jgi:hypothetical protein
MQSVDYQYSQLRSHYAAFRAAVPAVQLAAPN